MNKVLRTEKNLCVVLIACLIMLTCIFDTTGVWAAAEPEIEAEGAVLYCVNTDEVIYEKNPDEKFQPYSITKLLTAYIVAQNLDMDQEVTASKAASEIGESTMYLQEGEVVTIEQLMYGMLLQSGNDAAYALGEAVAGSNKAFAEMMNETATELGCTGSHFVNPNGMQSKNHYTTPHDFLLISKAAFSDPTVFKIAGTKKYEMPETEKFVDRTFKTHVDLLNVEGSGVVSGKTGYWEDDDCSIAAYYDKNDLKMIIVILKANHSTRRSDALKLLEYGESQVKGYKATTAGGDADRIWLRGGERTRVDTVTTEDAMAYPASGEDGDYKVRYRYNREMKAPLKKGDIIGTAEVVVNGEVQASSPVAIKETVEKGWLPSKLYISNRATIIILLVILLILVLRVINKRRAKKRRQERIRARAESVARRERELAEQGAADGYYTPKH